MCIIIDADTLGLVFNPETKEHKKFKPVLEWINNGKGKIVYGGTKYEKELINAKKLNLIKHYNIAGKAVHICDKKVDDKQTEIENRVNNPDFNDPQLVAIVCVSKCKLICSKDKEAYPFLTDHSLYQNEVPTPKIYGEQSFRRYKDLLNDSNIAECCKPCSKTTKKQRELLST